MASYDVTPFTAALSWLPRDHGFTAHACMHARRTLFTTCIHRRNARFTSIVIVTLSFFLLPAFSGELPRHDHATADVFHGHDLFNDDDDDENGVDSSATSDMICFLILCFFLSLRDLWVDGKDGWVIGRGTKNGMLPAERT